MLVNHPQSVADHSGEVDAAKPGKLLRNSCARISQNLVSLSRQQFQQLLLRSIVYADLENRKLGFEIPRPFLRRFKRWKYRLHSPFGKLILRTAKKIAGKKSVQNCSLRKFIPRCRHPFGFWACRARPRSTRNYGLPSVRCSR
jgi:hypothetical protein